VSAAAVKSDPMKKTFIYAQIVFCFALAASGAHAQQKFGQAAVRVEDQQARDQAIKLINNDLLNIGKDVSLRNCPLLMTYYKAKFETIYGGACILNNGTKVVLCTDTGIGQFALTESASALEAYVATFMGQNCPGG
jgi:hypothetical protein